MVGQSHSQSGGAGGAGTALVIGAGVSGCACAAALVEVGVGVQLFNSALDRVGHPAYGSELVAAGGWPELVKALASLPRVVRDVWVEAGVGPFGGPGVLAVDRRRISVELKRALEALAGLDLRQGLVCDVRLVGASGESVVVGEEHEVSRVAIETVFGEVFEADAVVLAVGLGLGGRVVVGHDVLPGGRYGETGAEGLVGALDRLGVRMREADCKVGPRFLRRSIGAGGIQEWAESAVWAGGVRAGGGVNRAVPLAELLRDDGVVFAGSDGWDAEFPPAPHWTRELQAEELYVDGNGRSEGQRLVLPDGCALGEVYVWPDGPGASEQEPFGGASGWREPAAVASRLGQEVKGLVVTDLGLGGRLLVDGAGVGPIWVTGRAGGSEDYLGSLQSGTRTGAAVAEALLALRKGGL